MLIAPLLECRITSLHPGGCVSHQGIRDDHGLVARVVVSIIDCLLNRKEIERSFLPQDGRLESSWREHAIEPRMFSGCRIKLHGQTPDISFYALIDEMDLRMILAAVTYRTPYS